jgi:hypothetical protein
MSASFFRFLPPQSKSTAALAAFSRSFSSFSACRFFLRDSSLFLEFACRLLSHGFAVGRADGRTLKLFPLFSSFSFSFALAPPTFLLYDPDPSACTTAFRGQLGQSHVCRCSN